MLVELRIANLVIVESAVLRPGAGLTAISGETGAGKSLLLDALDLMSGARVQGQMVGRWGDAAVVTGVFQPDAGRLAAIQAATGLPVEQEGQVILRRRIAAGGRSQAWINDEPVSVGALRSVASMLIEYHGQHEPIRLAERAVQMQIIDEFAGLGAAAAAYREAHGRVEELAARLAEVETGARSSLKEVEFIRFQLAEIESFAPRRGEIAELETRLATLSSVADLLSLAEEAQEGLAEGDLAVQTRLGSLARRLERAAEPRLARAGALCREASEVVRDAALVCGEVLDGLRPDPAALAAAEARLDAWRTLERKHGDGEEAVFAAWEGLVRRLQELEGLDGRRDGLRRELADAIARRSGLGERLAGERKAGFGRLATQVQAHLADLGMPKARLSLDESGEEAPGALGFRRQEMAVSTNPGLPPASIRAVASGGEMSRIMLAIAAAIGGGSGVPVMVFDEVDSGVGGRMGAVIGGKLARLAHGRTVLAVTHTPQLAASAERHYLVVKRQGERETMVMVREIAGEERIGEIADMLGGGQAAMDQSRTLLETR